MTSSVKWNEGGHRAPASAIRHAARKPSDLTSASQPKHLGQQSELFRPSFSRNDDRAFGYGEFGSSRCTAAGYCAVLTCVRVLFAPTGSLSLPWTCALLVS